MPEKAILKCSACGAAKDTTLTPKGVPRIQSQWAWKRRAEDLYCDDCWAKLYRLRAVVLPIRPRDPNEWPDLRAALKEVWGHTASLANWTMLELVKRDAVRTPEMSALPKMTRLYLYAHAKRHYPCWSWWQGQTQAANAILNRARKRWRKDRYAVLWRFAQSVPTFRFGLPYPLDRDAYEIGREHGDEPEDAYTLNASFAKRRWNFVFATAHQWRQKEALNKVLSGESLSVEGALYERRASLGDHRAVIMRAKPGGGRQTPHRLYATIVCWLPRSADIVSEVIRPGNTMKLKMTKDVFLEATIGDGEPWLLHADEAAERSVQHMLRLGMMADNCKYERRWPKRQRTKIDSYRDGLVMRHHDWIKTWIEKTALQVVGFAARNRVAEIHFDLSGLPFYPLPLYRLCTRLDEVADNNGIAFINHASGDVVDDILDAAREE